MKFIKPKALEKGDIIIPILPAGLLKDKHKFYSGKKFSVVFLTLLPCI